MIRRLLPLALLTLSTALAHAQVPLVELGTVDLTITSDPFNPEFIGSDVGAVAWNGTQLFVAGFNNTLAGTPCGIVEITNVLAGPPQFSPAFAVQATSSFRGYANLEEREGVLLAAYDLGAASPLGVSAWDTATRMLQWSEIARGNGAAFDPGFPPLSPAATDEGAAWIGIGQATRALNDPITGAVLYDTTSGMNVTPGGTTIWRGMDFDELSGDLWLRRANDLVVARRSGGNTCTPAVAVDNGENAPNINFQNLAVLNTINFGDLVIYNDRSTSAGGQAFTLRVRVIDAQTLAPVVVDWGSFNPPAGPGAYDFAWDSATNSLALMDFGARAVTIFQVGTALPEFTSFCNGDGGDGMGCTACPCGNTAAPGTIGGCLNSSGTSARLEASGNPSVTADTLRFELEGGIQASFALLATGATFAPTNPANPCFGQASGIAAANLDGLRCAVQDLRRHGTRAIDASGAVGAVGGTPGWGPPDGPAAGLLAQSAFVAGQTRYAQAFLREDPALGCGTGQSTSQGVSFNILP